MKVKFLMVVLSAGSLLLANQNTALTEEVLNVPQAPVVENVNPQATMQNPAMFPYQMMPMQPIQANQDSSSNIENPQAQQQNAMNPNPAQSAPMQPMQNPYAGGYGASLESIFAKVQKMYPNSMITDVDYEGYGYEIEVNGGMELFFDMNGNLLWQQWDW